MCFEVFRILNQQRRVNDWRERLRRQVATFSGSVHFFNFLIGSSDTHVCLLCKVERFVFTVLYWLNLLFTSLSMLMSSYMQGLVVFYPTSGILTLCKESINSASGLSARYLTLFQVKDRRYWSAGSVKAGQSQVR
jgi:hypothetical protein